MDPILAEDRLRIIAAQLSALNFSIKHKDIFCISIEIKNKAGDIKKFTIDDLPTDEDAEKSLQLKFIGLHVASVLLHERQKLNKEAVQ